MKKAVVFTKNNCTWCDQVKELLKIHGIRFVAFNIENLELVDEVMDFATILPRKGNTYPQVFEVTDTGMTLIGGYEDTFRHLTKVPH